jgi:phage shock protein A
MTNILKRIPLLAAGAGALALSACATVESVQHAQGTADQALSAAQAAQQTANGAQQTADQARSEVNALGQRVDALEAKHRGPRG